MGFIEHLVSGYMPGDCMPQDFIDHLTPGVPGFGAAITAVALAVVFGLLVYIFPIIIMETEHIGPYPLWLHCFYFAADFMGIWVFLDAWRKYQHFYLFLLLCIGEAVWVGMETYCLQRAMTYEKDVNWKPGTPFGKRLTEIILLILIFYVSLNYLRFELKDPTMWKFWPFTQVLITVVSGLTMEKRGYRSGNARILNICFICVALVTFNPWCNMWLAVAPDYFSWTADPWYYITGIVCLFFAIRGEVLYEKLPEKTDLMNCGKKPALK